MGIAFQLDPTRSEPLYLQVLEFLEDGIRNGTYPPETALPSELELTTRLKVSRPTVRRALQMLAEQGKVKSIPGRGTFVCSPVDRPARGRAFTLGLIVLELRDSFMIQIVNGIEHGAAQSNYHVLLSSSGNQIGAEEKILTSLWESRKVDGFILMPADTPQPYPRLLELAKSEVPIVLLDRFFEGSGLPFVCSDNTQGGYLITRHLIDHGHRHIAYLTRPNTYVTSVAQRIQGYRQALEECNLEYKPGLVFQGLLPFMTEVQILEGNTRRILEYDRKAIADFLTHHREVSAVFACNDILASLVYEVCQELGIRIPDELAVVGFDDTTITSLLNPPLTTIRQHAYDMGASAAGLLVDILTGAAAEREIYLPVEMVVRRSCGKHPENQP